MYLVESNFIKEEDPIVIDCRFEMSKPLEGYKAYKNCHLEGAYYMDLDKDMTGPVGQHGGRHPLKDLEVFTEKLATFGIEKQSKVLLYDDGSLAMACRLWMMMRLVGLEEIYILKGGYPGLETSGLKLTSDLSKTSKSDLKLDYKGHILSHVDEVRASLTDEDVVVIDARSHGRYLGLEEPLDHIAGHIPGSLNYFWQETLDETFEAQRHYKDLGDYKTIINQCGSGVTGCVNMFFMAEAQIESKLYLGSYSDWISYEDHDVVIKDQKVVKVKQVKHEKD